MGGSNKSLSYDVIGLAMEAHRGLGPGLDEIFYHRVLSDKLTNSGIEHEYKPKGRLKHRNLVADEFEADIIVENKLVLELKALRGVFSPIHYAQIISYLKFWSIPVGLLLDFGKESLITKRVVYDNYRHPDLDTSALINQAPPAIKAGVSFPILIEVLGRIYKEYGLGYRDTTYRGLIAADLSGERIPYLEGPDVMVNCNGKGVGEAKLGCFLIRDSCVLNILALRESIRAADRAVMQTHLKHLRLPWGIIANFGKKQFEIKYVLQTKN